MPKAAVQEDCNSVAGEDDVRSNVRADHVDTEVLPEAKPTTE